MVYPMNSPDPESIWRILMRYLRFLTTALALSFAVFAGFLAITSTPSVYAQSNISGDIAGTISDASGAALPEAQVTVTSLEKGNAKTVTTDHVGNYRVPLLSPGKYEVKVVAKGFAASTMQVTVSAGTITSGNMALAVGQTSTTVEVNAGEIAVLHVDDAQISTSFDLAQLQNLPNPGGDLTFVAQTTPGAIMNTQGGYGNFAMGRTAGNLKHVHDERRLPGRSLPEPEQLWRHEPAAWTERC
jgi:hypothetical protein